MEEHITFNINSEVQIRLLTEGRLILLARHNFLYRDLAGKLPVAMPLEDSEGWSTWQLWDLASTFGPFMHMTSALPFETTIRIPLAATPAAAPQTTPAKSQE